MNTGALQSVNPFLLNNLREGFAKKKAERQGAAGGKFSSMLQKSDEQTLDAASAAEAAKTREVGGISALLDEVHSTGDALSKHPFPDEIEHYKTAVRRFIRFVVDNAFNIEESEGIANKFKPQYKERTGEIRNAAQKYMMIGVIDQKLENLAAQIMASQGEKLKFLAHIDEINGLLINLLK
ncbi:MAG: DUF327 family protein [Spirochaetaceae bacterium]|jgi:uncharacterized protein YaaR (DUF327 family)|nr:DUF327 family protein [Spirochaetaceae bacterium]